MVRIRGTATKRNGRFFREDENDIFRFYETAKSIRSDFGLNPFDAQKLKTLSNNRIIEFHLAIKQGQLITSIDPIQYILSV